MIDLIIDNITSQNLINIIKSTSYTIFPKNLEDLSHFNDGGETLYQHYYHITMAIVNIKVMTPFEKVQKFI